MYLRPAHAESSLPILQQLIHDHPLGLLITSFLTPGTAFDRLQVTHLPWTLIPSADPAKPGVLRAHMARANPHAKAMIAQLKAAGEGQVLEDEVVVVFSPPEQSYVTPKFYKETKPADGKVVPTWNYSAVQATGRARIFWDPSLPSTDAYLSTHLPTLVDDNETAHLARDPASGPGVWKISDAPVKYTELLKKAIIGIEVEVETLVGKWKMSQELGEGDREGVVEGFGRMGEVGERIAGIVCERGRKVE